MRDQRTRNIEPTAAAIVAREQARAKREKHEAALLQQIRAARLPEPTREYRFDPARRSRLDFAWKGVLFFGCEHHACELTEHPIHSLAVEVEGVSAEGGRHQRIGGFLADAEKYMAATLAGFLVLRVTPRQVQSGAALRAIEALLGREG